MFLLNGAKLQYVDSYKYLGMLIHVHNDDLDIVRQLKSVILRTNILMRTFSSFSVEVKLFLFKTTVPMFTVRICNIHSMDEMRRTCIYSFIQRLKCSSNAIITCFMSSTFIQKCAIWNHWFKCLYLHM